MVKGASLPFLSRRTDLSTMSYAEPSIGNSGAFGLLLRVPRSFKAAGDNGTSKSLLPFVRDPGTCHTAPSISDHVAGFLNLLPVKSPTRTAVKITNTNALAHGPVISSAA